MCFFGRPGFKSREAALVRHKNEMNEGTGIICNRVRIVLGARQAGSVWKNEHDMIKQSKKGIAANLDCNP